MNYNNEPIILSSERLQFRQHIMADMDAYCAMEMDVEVRRYVGGHPRSREEAERRFMGSLKPETDQSEYVGNDFEGESTIFRAMWLYPILISDGYPD